MTVGVLLCFTSREESAVGGAERCARLGGLAQRSGGAFHLASLSYSCLLAPPRQPRASVIQKAKGGLKSLICSVKHRYYNNIEAGHILTNGLTIVALGIPHKPPKIMTPASEGKQDAI